MTVKSVNGTTAIAQSVKACQPQVVAGYPITPMTHVVEELEKYFANGEIPTFIAVEAEFSAISAVLGASAAGCRSFTATSAQGLLYMHEVLFAVSGMRLPVVMAVGNRAVSAPLSIWNDEQDSVSQRDAGWIQLYCKNNQEAADSIPQAFFIAEKTMLPVMVCIDGHFLTHTVEQVDLLEPSQVAKFLPPYKPTVFLDPKNPVSLGVYTSPAHYQEFRQDLSQDLETSRRTILEAGEKFKKLFGRSLGLVDEYQCSDATEILVGLGSAMENVRIVVDQLRKKGRKVGCLHIRSYRPFPRSEIQKILAHKRVGVIDRAISPGSTAPLYTEVSEALQGTGATVSSFVGALGGRMLTTTDVPALFETLSNGKPVQQWITVNLEKNDAETSLT